MRISDTVEAISADLAALGSLGDERTADAAHRLAMAMQATVTARLFDVLGQAAAELSEVLPGQRVEVRLVGGEAHLVVETVDGEPVPEEAPVGDGSGARITLRLPAQLKAKLEEASAREGLSVNSYVVRALNQQVRSERGFRAGHRLSGYGRS